MMLLSTTRPVMGVFFSLIGLGGSIAGLIMKQWFVCSQTELNASMQMTFGLQRFKIELTMPGLDYSGEDDVCSESFKQLLKSDVPCNTGKIGFGLGIAAAVLIGLGMVFGVTIACTRRLGGMWGTALASNLLGGLAAIASGAIYVGLMYAETSDGTAECKYLQVAPILMVAGGLVSLFASFMYCSCCCRPATSLPSTQVQQLPMQQWIDVQQGQSGHGQVYAM